MSRAVHRWVPRAVVVAIVVLAATAGALPPPDTVSSTDTASSPDTFQTDTFGGQPQADVGPPPTFCEVDTECEAPLICLYGQCTVAQSCLGNSDCWTDSCVEGICRQARACSLDSDCESDQLCTFGECRRCGEGCCRTDEQCGLAERCNSAPSGGPGEPPDKEVPPGFCEIDPAAAAATPECARLCDGMAPCTIAALAQSGGSLPVNDWIADCTATCGYVALRTEGAAGAIAQASECVAATTRCSETERLCEQLVFAVANLFSDAAQRIQLPFLIQIAPFAFPQPGVSFPDAGFLDVVDGDAIDGATANTGRDDGGCSGGGEANLAALALLAVLALITRRSRGWAALALALLAVPAARAFPVPSDAAAPPGCASDQECGEGFICVGSCGPPIACVSAADCWTDYCDGTSCRLPPPCETDESCGEGALCSAGSCVAGSLDCRDDAGCDPFEACFLKQTATAPSAAPGTVGLCHPDPDTAAPSVRCRAVCDALAPCSAVAAAKFIANADLDLPAWIDACAVTCGYVEATGGDSGGVIASLAACIAPAAHCSDIRAACDLGWIDQLASLLQGQRDAIVVPDDLFVVPPALPVPGSFPFQPDDDGAEDVVIDSGAGCAAGVGGPGGWVFLVPVMVAALAARLRRLT